MKVTWFGATAFRVYLGGQIVVIDPETALQAIDREEIVSGADRIVDLSGGRMATIDPATWRPVRPARVIDAPPQVEIVRVAATAVVIAAASEPPLAVLGPGEMPRFGRWIDGAVVVMASDRPTLVAGIAALLDAARPHLIALAVNDPGLDEAIAEIAERLDGAGLISLEPGLAVEV